MTKLIIVATLALVAAAIAAPVSDPNSVVPETALVQTAAYDAKAHKAAKKTIAAMLESGSDESACGDLATSIMGEVTSSVAEQQSMLDGLPDGSECASEGSEAVGAAEAAVGAASSAKDAADEAAEAAKSAPVDFGTHPLSSVSEGECSVLTGDAAYLAAKSALATAEAEAEAAGSALTDTETALEDAKSAAADAKKACECSAYHSYHAAFEAAQAHAAEHTTAWTKGKHMECVLAGTDPAACDVGTPPTVTVKALAPGVDGADCPAAESAGEAATDYSTREPETLEGDAPNPTEGVTFYKHCGSGGYRSVIFHDVADVSTAGMMRNDVSAVYVPKGWKVDMYDGLNYEGAVKSFHACSGEDNYVDCLVSHGYNDKMESAKMSPC